MLHVTSTESVSNTWMLGVFARCGLASCVIQFTYTDRYPDDLPIMEIMSSENLDDESVDSISLLMTQLVKSAALFSQMIMLI